MRLAVTNADDTTAPVVEMVSATGPGLVGGSGTLTVGQILTLTLKLSEPVTVMGASDPTLSLSHGGVASLDRDASEPDRLVFRYVVLVDQTAADLSIAGVQLNGATIVDEAGNALELGGTITNPDGVLRIDGYTGTDASETFRGSDGSDVFRGMGGDDTYYVNHGGDVVYEVQGGGYDRVLASVNHQLLAGQEIELFTTSRATGTAAINLTGNSFDQRIIGNAGDNILNGKGGADRLEGLAGNDIYYVKNVGDVVIELANTSTIDYGIDTVRSLIDFKIRPNIEYLTLLGSKSINGTGNATDNIITGNTGDNVINGAGGADLMRGLAGADTYYVDNVGDVVVEAAGAGSDIDTVKALIDYTLTANVENLSLIGADGIDGTGNGLANLIVGNTGDNRLAGRLGSDTLKGRGGSDTFVFDTRPGEADADHVVDFTSADQIELSSAIFTALSSGPLSAAAFKDVSEGLLDTDDRILYDRSTGKLFYDRDGSGSAASELIAVLDNHAALTAASFIIS